MVCIDGYETQIVINFVYINNSIELVPTPKTVQCSQDYSPIIAMVFLILIFIAAFILSTLVIVTIFISYSPKEQLLSNLIVNICSMILIDCLFNLIISISYVGTGPWEFGYEVCNFNGFSMNVAATQMSFCVACLALDRVLVARKVGRYMRITQMTIRLIIVATWVLSLCISLPLSWGLIKSAPFPFRYSCSVTDKNEEYHAIVQVLIIVIIVPSVVMFAVIHTFFIFYKEQKKHKKVKGSQTLNLFDQILMTPYYRDEVHSSLCVGIIVLMYLCCWVPFFGVMSLDSLLNNHWEGLNRNITLNITGDDPFPTKRIANIDNMNEMNMSRKDILRRVASKSNVSMTITEEELIDEVIQNSYVLVFTWLRYIMDLLVPIVFLGVMKNLREKCTALIFFCKPNSVDASTAKMILPRYSTINSKANINGIKDNNVVSFKTPVLFSTSEGLHLRTVEEEYLSMLAAKPILAFKSSNPEPQFSYGICDVMPGYDDVTDIEEVVDVKKQYDFESNQIDFDEEGNPIVKNAQRTAVNRKVYMNNKVDKNVFVGQTPPTPPKERSSSPKEDLIFDSTIEMKLTENRKSAKNVRFNTQLNEEIIPPNTPDSVPLESSSTSGFSSDSGNLGDVEEQQIPQSNGQTFTVIKKPTMKVKKKRSISKPNKKGISKRRKNGNTKSVRKVKRIQL